MDILVEVAIEVIGGLIELAIDQKRNHPKKKYIKVAKEPFKTQDYNTEPIFTENKDRSAESMDATKEPKKNNVFTKSSKHQLEEGLKKQIPSYFSEKALYLMIILFIFYENDGKFSKDEKKQIKTFLERQEIALGDDQNKVIKKVARKRPSVKKINNLIHAQHINSLIVENILNRLEHTLKDTPSYLTVVQELHNNLHKKNTD